MALSSIFGQKIDFFFRNLFHRADTAVAPDAAKVFGKDSAQLSSDALGRLADKSATRVARAFHRIPVSPRIPEAGDMLDPLTHRVPKAAVGIDLKDASLVTKTVGDRSAHVPFSQAQIDALKAKLSPDQLGQYNAIMPLGGDAVSQDQFHALLANGTLLSQDTQKTTMLGNLATIATKPTTNGLNPTQVIQDTVKDVTDPTTIATSKYGTCTAGDVQAALAQMDPAEYSRLVAGLSTGDGKVLLQDGKTVASSANFIAQSDRTTTSNLLQPSFMDVEGRFEGNTYNTALDNYTPDEMKMSDHDMASLASVVLGRPYWTVSQTIDQQTPDVIEKMMTRLYAATPDKPLFTGIVLADGGAHEVQVVKADATNVVIRNPWGEVDTIPTENFKNALYAINAPKARA